MTSDFIKRTLTQLHAVERHASTSKQHDALRNSMLTLHFIMGRGEAGEFADYLEGFGVTSSPPVLSFATKEDADVWLRNHPAPPHGAVIGVGDARYHVAYSRELEHRKLLRLPSEEEWKQMREAGEDPEPEAEDESEPQEPGHGSMFSLFGLAIWTFFHLYEMEKRIASAEELEAIRIARISFHFVMDVGEEYGFEAYLETVHSARTSRPLESFENRADVDTWLEHQPEPPPPAVVAIGNDLYSVGYNRRRRLRMLIRIPTGLGA